MQKFVVIAGMYRSGTTLAETIIGSHPDISIPPRDFHFFEFYRKGEDLRSVYQGLEKRDVWRRLKEEIDRKRNGAQAADPDFAGCFNGSPRDAYIGSLTRYAQMIGKSIPGVKCPLNEFYFDTIQEWLSGFQLKFIHLVRNPFDMIASFQKSSYYPDSLKSNPVNIGVHSKNWCRSASLALARAFYNPDRYCLLRYEDLALEPKTATRKLCDFIEVDFDEKKMLNARDYEYYGANTSFGDQKRQAGSDFVKPPQSRKDHLQTSQVKVIASICGELANALGYPDEDFVPAAPENLRGPQPWLKKQVKRLIQNILSE